jgi:hypothetical protein
MPESVSKQVRDGETDFTEKEYELAISLMTYHIDLLWKEFGVFLLAETVLIGFIGTTWLDKGLTVAENLGIWFVSLFGFLLCVPWLAIFKHNYQYYLLRIEQAKRHEPAVGSTLLSEGQRLSAGNTITVNNVELRLPPLARHLPPRLSVKLLIYWFAVTFFTIFVLTGPWW